MVRSQEVNRLWIVSELYYPEETSTGYFLTGIAEGLADQFQTAVIASQPTYAARGVRAPRRESRNGVAIRRVRSTRLDPRVLPFRVVNALTISAAMFLEVILQVRHRDLVIVVTNPPTLPLVVRMACRLHGSRCILLVHDVYPEVLGATGTLRRKSVAYRILDRFSQLLYRGFDRVVVIGRDMQELVAPKTGRPQAELPVITNWGDPRTIVPREGTNPFRERHGLGGKFVVQYGGNIGRTHGVDALLGAAKALEEDRSIHFLVIGEGARKRAFEDAIARNSLHNITLLSTVPRDQLSSSLTACDIALITLVPGMKGVSVPSRMYNILAAGKPIIAMAEEGSELALVVREEQVGWVIPPADIDALVRTIHEAKARFVELNAMGKRGREAVERRYRLDHVIRDWTALVRGLMIDE